MDDDFNEQFDEIFGGEGDTPDLTPTWRATIRRGRLMLTGWAPWLITGGPMGNLLPERARSGVTIADLTIHCEDQSEISVHYLVRTDRDYDPEEILADWAQQVGHRRIWFPDRMVELPPDPEQITGVTVRCDNCRARWSDGTPEFWLGVRQAKAFPKWCPMCGCEMPQWTARPARPEADARPHKGSHWSESDSRRRERQEKT